MDRRGWARNSVWRWGAMLDVDELILIIRARREWFWYVFFSNHATIWWRWGNVARAIREGCRRGCRGLPFDSLFLFCFLGWNASVNYISDQRTSCWENNLLTPQSIGIVVIRIISLLNLFRCRILQHLLSETTNEHTASNKTKQKIDHTSCFNIPKTSSTKDQPQPQHTQSH